MEAGLKNLGQSAPAIVIPGKCVGIICKGVASDEKIGLLALGLALALGVVAEAGSIPADRVPLQTYAVKK